MLYNEDFTRMFLLIVNRIHIGTVTSVKVDIKGCNKHRSSYNGFA